MLKAIIVYVLFCFLKQNYAFVLRPDAGFLHQDPKIQENYVNDNHIFEKRNEQTIYPNVPFVVKPNPEDGALQMDVPQYEGQFVANGFQAEFHSEFNSVPFSSGSLLDTRQIGGDQSFPQNGVVSGPQNQDQQVFKSETFELTPEYQKLYENDQLVEQLPNQSQTSPKQGSNQNGSGTGSPQQTSSSSQQIPSTNNNPQQNTQTSPSTPPQTQLNIPPQLNQAPIQQTQSPIQSSQPLYPSPSMQQQPSYLPPSMQSPSYAQYTQPPPSPQYQQQFNPSYGPTQPNPLYPSSQTQPNLNTGSQPVIKMASVGAGSSTFASSNNNQPPQVSQNAAAYNYNYDSTRPNPVSGNYVAVNGNTPNLQDPKQGNYRIAQGTFPTQPNNGQFIPQNGQSIYRNQAQPINYINSLAGQQIVDPNIMNTLNNQLGQLPMNPMSLVAPFQNFAQGIPRLVQNTIYQGLELMKIPPHMMDSALYTLNKDLENITAKDFVQLPAEGGRLIVNTIQQLLSEFQKGVQSLPLGLMPPMPFTQPMQPIQPTQQMQTMQPMQQIPPMQAQQQMQQMQQMQPMLQQPQQPQVLARRSAEPWMSNLDLSQLSQYYSNIPFGTAQEKISNMKNEIFNKIQTPSFPQFPFISKPTVPSISTAPSVNGEPVVKVFSSSVSESTQSSSKNGAPPEVAHQATGFKYDYDSTNAVDPVQADLVGLKSYTPNANDPSQGEYVAFENSYPKHGSN